MNTSKFTIKVVADNAEKGNSYRENLKRYNKANASGFYLECLWILYAMLEDRTSAFLYYLGFTSEQKRNKATGSKKIKSEVRRIFHITDSNAKYKFDTISGKLSRIEEVLLWGMETDSNVSDYQAAVKIAVLKIASDSKTQDAFTYLNNEWRDKRNQLTHSLFNKDPNAVVSELKALVEKGYTAVRWLDASVALLKKEKIRDRFKVR